MLSTREMRTTNGGHGWSDPYCWGHLLKEAYNEFVDGLNAANGNC